MPHSSGYYYHVAANYWANGVLKQVSGLSGLPTISYNVDGEGRVYTVSASSGQNPVTNTTYNVASEALKTNLGSSDTDSFTYDPNTFRETQYTFDVNGQAVVGKLSWNANGTLASLAITDPFDSADVQNCSYAQDDLSRIASASCGSAWSQTITYDAFGNLSKNGTQSFQPTYSSLTNHMTQIGSSTPTYDLNGNVTNDVLHSYAWDATGRPVTIDGVVATYDALGRMVEQNRSGIFTEIVYLPSGVKLALMNGTALQKAFLPLPGGATAVYNSSGLAYYRHSDWLGSSRFASTSTPPTAMYYDGAYGPFGEVYAQTGTPDSSFTGLNQDTAANLSDFPAREYGSQGRWPSPDPSGIVSVQLSNPQSLNRYAYVMNSPLSYTDPQGLHVNDCWWYGTCMPGGGNPLVGGGGFGPGDGGFGGDVSSLGCTLDGADVGCAGLSSGLGSNGIGVSLSNTAIYLFGGTPFLTGDLSGILADPSNPPLAFQNDIVTLDPQGADITVGVFVALPNSSTPWTFSFVLPVVPILIYDIPIGDIGITGSITYIPGRNANPATMCSSSGFATQFPPSGNSFSAGPITNGNVQSIQAVETGPSTTAAASVIFGYQTTFSTSGTAGGPIASPFPGFSMSATTGSCAVVPQ